MSRYAELDEAIVGYIARNRKNPMHSSAVGKLSAEALGRDSEHGDEKEWRLIDRRLQAIRKAGRIKYEKATINGAGGWRVVDDNEGAEAC